MVRQRVLPGLGVVLITIVVTGALTGGVYARGLAFTLGPVGAVAHLPALAVQVALVAALLRWAKGMTRAEAGLVVTPRDLGALALTLLVTTLGLVALVGLAGALTGHPLARSGGAASPVALLVAALSFVGSSAVQQVTTQSLALATSPAGGISRGGAAVAVAVFVLAHAQASQAPLYLANVALFALAGLALFTASRRRSYALPLGLHAGWNFAQVALLGAPVPGQANTLAPLRWPGGPPWLFGGANGLDEGVLFTVALVPAFAVAWRIRRRASTAG
ncbi:MAG: hypothetical protein U0325_10390 [Polyangiales bacterium]